ncbi:MAG: leucine--tRNA ligase [Prevotellaceae bacterium]|jgi:leucyl-tRNA synthetase|nr:leucine--tRNA ligase [Prevotellaceae bacterium]
MEYNFREIEQKWQKYWAESKIYKVEITDKPKFYVLDMFPYPSGAGLHVGHPLGYIASDIFSRYKRLCGFNVLHPMGYDAYGLPAEQYAIQTGQHPSITTETNIKRYREQLDKIGFCFDWDREVRTCDPKYYKWTQWAFVQMFNSYYCNQAQQARPISELIEIFSSQGTSNLDLACSKQMQFTAEEWNSKNEKEQQEILLNYRIAYLADTMVNWCPALGTVLANDEVSEGLSIRGGYPVEQKIMRQWSLRVSAYAQRLLDDLEKLDWSESLKETQRNWIGRSEGAEIRFYLSPDPSPQERGEELPKGKFKPTTDVHNWNKLIEIAKTYRSKQTDAEDKLWQDIRASKIGYKIRRQHIIDGYIADFVNLEKRVIIEVDGGIHSNPEQKEKDELRTQILNQCGFNVFRVSNEEIFADTLKTAKKIKDYLDSITDKNVSLSCGEGQRERFLTVFTTRADTIFGVTFMVLAPESEYAAKLTTEEQKQDVAQYIERTKRRTERERIADRSVTGVFTGSYATNPVNGKKIPIWISDYVLATYGTGMIMAVPAHDSRDYAFAKHFGLPVIPLVEGCDVSNESFDAKDGIMINSGFLNGLTVTQAIEATKKYIEENKIGKRKVNYRLRDAIFSRQRYWGEPFPIYYKQGMPYAIDEKKLPLELPDIDKFLPTETGEPPLGRAKNWQTAEGFPLELNTMPGFAGSSAYYLRYMDPHNDEALVSPEANKYWKNVDLYVGGTEHATGHLIYSRFWNKFLFDSGLIIENEPFKKLINQGMIQGRSNFVYRIKGTNKFVSLGLKDKYDTTEIHVDVSIVKNDILDIEKFKNWMPDFNNAEFILEDGKYICGYAVEKMSKSMYNVVNPDVIVESYGADTLRMYEMFLGPVEQSKPWDTNGIDGVHRFLRRFWLLFFDKDGNFKVSDEKANQQELKCLHKTIKKIQSDIENFSFNTSVSAFMICVNELMTLKCNKREILEPLVIILSPFAPHVTEEIWHLLGHTTSICDAVFPEYNEDFLTESTFEYPVSFNGKVRFKKELPLTFDAKQVEEAVLADSATQKWLEDKTPKKVIVVVGKIVNVVI